MNCLRKEAVSKANKSVPQGGIYFVRCFGQAQYDNFDKLNMTIAGAFETAPF